MIRLKSGSQWAEFLSEGSGEKSTAELTLVVGGFQFLWLYNEDSIPSSELGSHSAPGGTTFPTMWPSPSTVQQKHVESFLCAESLTLPSVITQRKQLFKGSWN